MPTIKPIASEVGACAALLLAGLLAVVAIDPRAEVALNDDWAYALPVELLVEHGLFKLTFWQSMPLLPQIAWGALFVAPFGFSFTGLRVSVLVLAGIALVFAFLLLRRRGVPLRDAVLGAGCLLASPIYLALAHSFMTDVPFLALCLASAWWYWRALPRPDAGGLWIAVVLSMLAALVRQIGVALPVSYGIVLLLAHGVTRRSLWQALWPTLLVAAMLPAAREVLSHTSGLPSLYDARNAGLTNAVSDLLKLNLGALAYPLQRSLLLALLLGLTLLPWLAARAIDDWPRHRRQTVCALLGGAALALVLLALGRPFPTATHGNILLASGIGPLTIGNATDWASPLATSWAFTILASLGAGMLVVQLAQRLAEIAAGWRVRPDIEAAFCLLVALMGFAPLALAYGPYFDRHALLVLPLALLALAPPRDAARPPMRPAAVSTAAAFWLFAFCFAVAATHDYLGWQRARWELARSFTGPIATLDAGFEFDNYVEQHALLSTHAANPNQLAERATATHGLAFLAPPGARVIDRRATGAWLSSTPPEVVLFRFQPRTLDVGTSKSDGEGSNNGQR